MHAGASFLSWSTGARTEAQCVSAETFRRSFLGTRRDTQAKAKGHESSSDHNHEWIIARCGAQYAVCSGATLVR